MENAGYAMRANRGLECARRQSGGRRTTAIRYCGLAFELLLMPENAGLVSKLVEPRRIELLTSAVR